MVILKLAAMLSGMLLLSGCSALAARFFPSRSNTVEFPPESYCSIELTAARASLPRRIEARGVPKLLVIRDPSASVQNGAIRIGDQVYLHASAPGFSASDESPAATPGTSHSAEGGATQLRTNWIIEGWDSKGHRLKDGDALMDQASIRLRRAGRSGYLRARGLNAASLEIVSARSATRFTIYKADSPDATYPTTCDGTVRDSDYIFVLSTRPGAWIDLSATGGPFFQPQPSPHELSRDLHNGLSLCDKNEERCHTLDNGRAVCARQPVCEDLP